MKRIAIGVLGLLIVAGTIAAIPSDTQKLEPPKSTRSMVALGDSVAAGEGLMTDSDASACNRTDESYPSLVARMNNLRLSNIACSGATILSGLSGKQDVNKLFVTAQLEKLLAFKKVDIVTLTIGANDIGWTEFLEKCYTAVCGSNEDTALVNDRSATMQKNLGEALNQIANTFGPRQRMYVVGYYQVVPISGSCSDLAGIGTSELAWIRQMQASINTSVQAAVATFPISKFVAVDFSGHELCTTDPWVQGLQDRAPYHPTATGQQQIAKQLSASLSKDQDDD